MKIVHTKQELRECIASSQGSIGFVPTMGALHEGHLSLVRAARAKNDRVVVSIFVNPAQFGPGEDFEKYPRTLEDDCELLLQEHVDVVFAPSAQEIYGAPSLVSTRTKIIPSEAASRWEGALRPGHFEGVCLVVSKLFNLVQPTRAYFGEKDFQQLAVIKAMVQDFDIPLEIIGRPIVREDSGLALSSRNTRLTAGQRRRAAALSQAMQMAVTKAERGEQRATILCNAVVDYLTEIFGSDITIGYVAIVDEHSLQPLESAKNGARLILSVELFGIHLIDNMAI